MEVTRLSDDLKQKTADNAKLYFEGVSGERPYERWRSFDKDLARDLSLLVVGQFYAREGLPHPVRSLGR